MDYYHDYGHAFILDNILKTINIIHICILSSSPPESLGYGLLLCNYGVGPCLLVNDPKLIKNDIFS